LDKDIILITIGQIGHFGHFGHFGQIGQVYIYRYIYFVKRKKKHKLPNTTKCTNKKELIIKKKYRTPLNNNIA